MGEMHWQCVMIGTPRHWANVPWRKGFEAGRGAPAGHLSRWLRMGVETPGVCALPRSWQLIWADRAWP